MKLKGGILYYSLIVIILCSSIIGLILLSSFYENRMLVNSIKQSELERNVFSTINLFLGGEDIFKGKDSTTIELFDSNSNKVLILKKRWGNYYLVCAGAGWKHESFFREALVGSDLFSDEPIALFMPDEGRFLSLSGKTELKGTCYLPGKTARVASIEGQQYIYKNLVFGEIKKSPPVLPEINQDILSFAAGYLNEGLSRNDSTINIESLDSNHFENSFKNKTVIINTQNVNSLSGYSFYGNIIIWSSLPLVVEESSKLDDVILFAPKILIKSGFKGIFQAYAIQSITIEKDCVLGFPSQLCVIQSESRYDPSDSLTITLAKGSRLVGGAIIKSAGLTSFIKIDKEASITGQVYCPGIVELQGEVIGSLYTRTFYLGTSRARYYNHLLNTRIDFNSLSKYFVGIDLLKEIPKKSIIKWLD
jgi:hypothetical protein